MRKTFTALLLAAILPSVALAMPEGGPHRAGEHGPRMLFKELDLSPEQRSEFKKLMGEQMKTRHEITRRYLDKLPEAEKKAMQAEQEAAKAKHREAVNALLTPEQQKIFEEHRQKMQQRHAERGAAKTE